MLLPFLCVFGVAFLCFLWGFSIYSSNEREIHLSFTATLGFFGGMIVWLFASYILENKVTEKTYHYKETPIVSIKNDTEVEGAFFLGCGYVGETEYYYFFKKVGRDYVRESIPTYKARIRETNSKRPCIAVPYEVEHIEKSKYKHPKLWFLNIEDETKYWSGEAYFEDRIIYVPVGTIVTKFELH